MHSNRPGGRRVIRPSAIRIRPANTLNENQASTGLTEFTILVRAADKPPALNIMKLCAKFTDIKHSQYVPTPISTYRNGANKQISAKNKHHRATARLRFGTQRTHIDLDTLTAQCHQGKAYAAHRARFQVARHPYFHAHDPVSAAFLPLMTEYRPHS